MTMTTAEFKRLKDFLMRAAATDSDPEAIQCFRRATAMLAKHGHTWEQAMDRVVRVIEPLDFVEDRPGATTVAGEGRRSKAAPARQADPEGRVR